MVTSTPPHSEVSTFCNPISGMPLSRTKETIGTTKKTATAKDACTLLTPAELLAAGQGRTTPTAFSPSERTTASSDCELGAFEARNEGSVDHFQVFVDNSVGATASEFKSVLRQLQATGRAKLWGLPKGFVGVSGLGKQGSGALAVQYVAYSKQSRKLLVVGGSPRSFTAEALKSSADGVIKGLFMLAVGRI
jgi:hypothetical protein